jgi:hypothetical protein
MARWMIILVAAVAVVYVATVLISGEAVFLIPGGILLVLVVGYAVAERALTKAHLRRHGGDPGEAMRDDDDWAIPSAHLIPDDDRPAGDSPELHDEISPHDLPLDHPGRKAAEEQAGGEEGTTSGNEEGAQGGGFARTTDETDERTGERQRSADHAKGSGGAGVPGTSAGHGDGPDDRPGQELPL